jgi:serine protease
MPVKVLNDNGSGPFADIADGIYYAVDNGAEVINMSLGVNARFNLRNDPVMDPALDYAHAQGVTVVCASGNHGSHKNVSYPAIYPTTISVGATDALSEVTRYSNRGDGLDLVAPGGDMTKDRNGDGYVDGVFQETRSNGSWAYYFFEGTSMASPHVASAAAMLYAYGTATDALGVHEALTSTALDLDEPGYDSTSGFGLLQIYGALLYGGCLDLDSDGYSTCEGDCNDSDATIYPGAEELCGDGLDDNCDGTIDEGCVSCIDADDDGWCVDQGDCDDGNRRVYPGHGDTKGKWGRTGVDNDCNGIIDG